MKFFLLCAFAAILLAPVHSVCVAQQNNESEIRRLEKMETEAILKGDTIMLVKLLSPQVVVHNPENAIVNFDKIFERMRTGKIDYSSFERVIENISFAENIAIVMGKEIITPERVTINAGKRVTRSFTNIWMKYKGSWRLTARQATVIAVQ